MLHKERNLKPRPKNTKFPSWAIESVSRSLPSERPSEGEGRDKLIPLHILTASTTASVHVYEEDINSSSTIAERKRKNRQFFDRDIHQKLVPGVEGHGLTRRAFSFRICTVHGISAGLEVQLDTQFLKPTGCPVRIRS